MSENNVNSNEYIGLNDERLVQSDAYQLKRKEVYDRSDY